ncbi:MAG: methyltransferase domain-containing protein [Pseudomonadota bacterium]
MSDYDKHTINSPNPVARLAHRSRFDKAVELVRQQTNEHGTVLDFGSGTGAFLKQLRPVMPNAQLKAFEPYMENAHNDSFSYVGAVSDIPDRSIDTIGSFEVLEHLSDEDVSGFFDLCHSKLKPEGSVVVSVPIMIGLSLPIKEFNRSIFSKYKRTYTIPEMLRGTVGLPVVRARNRLASHKGFDFRDIVRRFDDDAWRVKTQYSPFSALKWSLNSQIFIVAKPTK